MGALTRPDLPPGPARDLVEALHDLHHRAGRPSLRSLAAQVGCSPTTVSAVFSSPRLPTWGVLELVVEALDGAVEEFRSLWLAGDSPDDAPAGAGPQIAGRRDELRAVRHHLTGGRGLLLVTGEAGIGKTRLVGTAGTLAAGSTFVASGSCLPLSSQVPLLPVADVLRATYDVDGGRWLKDAVTDCAPYVARSLHPLLPELDLAPGAPPAPEDDWARQRLLGALEATLDALAAISPFAVLLEDLHWADSATLDFVEHLLARRVAVPVLGTLRLDDADIPEQSARRWTRVQRSSTCTTLLLHPLSRDETAEQLTLLGHGGAPELVDRIHRRSAGQPLFTEQLAGLGDAEDLPPLLGDLLDRRLAGLGEPAAAVARALGVADRPLSDDLLAEVTGLDSSKLVGALHELAARHLLGPAAGHEVELRHPLLAEAVRRGLVALELVDEHHRIALALSRSVEPSPAEVAEHWQRAEHPDEEVVWRIRAAQSAAQRFALAQEASQWRRALAVWPRSGSPVLRLSRHDAFLAAMDALLFTDVATAWEVAEQAMHELPDPTGAEAAATYRRAGSIRGWLDDPHGGVQLVERALHIHRSTPPSVEHVRALHEHDTLLYALGRYEEAAASSLRALDICAGLDAPALHRSLLIQQAFHDMDSRTTGNLDRAVARLDEAAGVELTGPDPEGDIFLAVARTEVLRTAGRVGDEIVDAGRAGLESAAAWGIDSFPAHMVRGNMSAALRLSGQVDRAAELIDPVVSPDGPTHEDSSIHYERASIDMLRGQCTDALARFDTLSTLPMAVLSNRIEAAEHVASTDLWCGRPRQALDRLVAVLRDAVATGASAEVGADLALAARAAADVADASGATDAVRRELLARLERLHDQAWIDPFTSSGCFLARPAHGAAWAAESARLVGHPSLDLWSAAARRWDGLGRPHDAAYCRWREAQVALASGQGTLAARLLRRAAHDAREHVPLAIAVAETSRQVRDAGGRRAPSG